MQQAAQAPLRSQLDFNLRYMLPLLLQGMFRRNRYWTSLFARLHRDPLGVAFERRLRRRCHASHVWLRMATKRSLFVFSDDSIERILARSPAVYAEPSTKRRGMGYFMPEAVTISRGLEWEQRRRLNEQVVGLAAAEGLADTAREVVGRALQRNRPSDELRWSWFERVFQDIALELLFGERGLEERQLADDLKALMARANRLVLLRQGRRYERFRARLEQLVLGAEGSCLAGRARRANRELGLRLAGQLPHWLFAIQDTLAENVMRAVALVAAHPEAQDRVRALAPAGHDVNAQAYLEGCLQEAMRLYPTTPLIVREVIRADVLGDFVVAPGDQVVIPNMMLHRNAALVEHPDRFRPEDWRGGPNEPRFYHLSNGRQGCPGRQLALLLGQLVLGRIFAGWRIQLRRPRLDPGAPLPHALNVYSLSMGVRGIDEQ